MVSYFCQNEEYCKYVLNTKYWDTKFLNSNSKYKDLFKDILKKSLNINNNNRCDINYIYNKL